jgi:hypothetical protein
VRYKRGDKVLLLSKPNGVFTRFAPLTVGREYEVLYMDGSNVCTTTDRPGEECSYNHERVQPALDHRLCYWSTGIHDGLTVGQGELDSYGYWDVPCPVCARAAEKRNGKPEGTYWPFPANKGD